MWLRVAAFSAMGGAAGWLLVKSALYIGGTPIALSASTDPAISQNSVIAGLLIGFCAGWLIESKRKS